MKEIKEEEKTVVVEGLRREREREKGYFHIKQERKNDMYQSAKKKSEGKKQETT